MPFFQVFTSIMVNKGAPDTLTGLGVEEYGVSENDDDASSSEFEQQVDQMTGGASHSLYSRSQRGPRSGITASQQASLCHKLGNRVEVLYPEGKLVLSTGEIDQRTREVLGHAPISLTLNAIGMVNEPLAYNEEENRLGVLPARADLDLLEISIIRTAYADMLKRLEQRLNDACENCKQFWNLLYSECLL